MRKAKEKVWRFGHQTLICLVIHHQLACYVFAFVICKYKDSTGGKVCQQIFQGVLGENFISQPLELIPPEGIEGCNYNTLEILMFIL